MGWFFWIWLDQYSMFMDSFGYWPLQRDGFSIGDQAWIFKQLDVCFWMFIDKGFKISRSDYQGFLVDLDGFVFVGLWIFTDWYFQ
jgi:hypothetical protein